MKHIKFSQKHNGSEAWCKKHIKLHEMHFKDIDHAVFYKIAPSHDGPCKDCVNEVIKTLTRE